MLFMGEEWAASTPWQFFTSHPEPELGRATAEGRIGRVRRAWAGTPTIVPDPQDPETFRRSKLDWAEVDDGGTPGCLDVYRQLIALRRNEPDLSDPWLDDVEGGRRRGGAHRKSCCTAGGCVVACNLGSEARPRSRRRRGRVGLGRAEGRRGSHTTAPGIRLRFCGLSSSAIHSRARLWITDYRPSRMSPMIRGMTHPEFLPIPPIETATDPMSLGRTTCASVGGPLMGPLGFGERLLWIGFVGPDRRMVKALSQVPLGPRPRRPIVASTMTALARRARRAQEPGTTVALLLSAAGDGGRSQHADRQWAKWLVDG